MATRVRDDWPRPPGDLRVTEVGLDGVPLIVLSFPVGAAALPQSLTRAEREIAECVLAGHRNAEIARIRRTSVSTVAKQVASLFAKVGASTRSEFVARVSTGEP